MDSTIPQSAAELLNLIGNTEAPKGYDTIFGNHQSDLPKPITSMTLNEILVAGAGWASRYGSSACGRYQFMTLTLKSLKTSEGMSGLEQFVPDLQDRLGYALLDRRGYEQFLAGRISITDFGLALAKEWASFPVLADCQGAHRPVKRGETYYAGDKLNKALISPETVESVLALHPKPTATSHIEALFAGPASSLIIASSVTSPASDPKVQKLIELGEDDDDFRKILSTAKGFMDKAGLGRTLHNACAATLSALLRAAGFNIPVTLGAGVLASKLKNAGWSRVTVGNQRPGDVGVAKANLHIFLVLETEGNDIMVIADNQGPHKHYRAASGNIIPGKFRGTTATDYFLRSPDSPGHSQLAGDIQPPEGSSQFPDHDEDTSIVAGAAFDEAGA